MPIPDENERRTLRALAVILGLYAVYVVAIMYAWMEGWLR